MAEDTSGLNERLHNRLVEAARAQQTVTYSELEPMLKLDMGNPNDRRRIAELLGEISRGEVAHGPPMSSSGVLDKDGAGLDRGFNRCGCRAARALASNLVLPPDDPRGGAYLDPVPNGPAPQDRHPIH